MAYPQSLCSGDLLSLGLAAGEFLCSETRFDGGGERCVLAHSFSNGCVFRITSKRGLGSPLLYGEDVQLVHVSSGLNLQTLQVAAIERECFKLCLEALSLLARPGDDPSTWRIMPRYKIRSEGEPVSSDDQISLQAYLPNHFAHFLHVSGDNKEEQLNVSLQLTTWVPRLFRSYGTEASQLLAGSVLRFHHPEHDAWLACSLDQKVPRATLHAQALVRQWTGKGGAALDLASGVMLEKRQAASSLWMAEHCDVTAGSPITHLTPFRLRNLLTDAYLGVNARGLWELQSASSALLSLRPRHDAPIKLGFPVHLHAASHWLSTSGMDLVSRPAPSAADSFLVAVAAPETVADFAFVWSRRKQLLLLHEMLKVDDGMLPSQLGTFCQVLSDLARFCIVSEGVDLLTIRGAPVPAHQALLTETGTIMTVADVLQASLLLVRQKHPQSVAISRLVSLAYSVLRLTANANKLTQHYLVHYLPLLQQHLALAEPITSQVLDVLRFVYFDNGELVVSIPREDLVRYVAYLGTSVNAPIFLSALCNVGLKGIKFTQDVFLQHLPPGFMPKLRAAKFRERSDEKMLPVYIVEIVVQDEKGGETWTELEEWFASHNSASVQFESKFRFLRSLTLGRNQQAIDFIRAALPFDCLLAILQSKLPSEVKRHVCEVLNRAYVDCAPNVAVLGMLPLIRVHHKFRESKHDEVSDVQWKLKDFVDGCLQNQSLLRLVEQNPHSEQYVHEHGQVVYASNLLSMLRKMVVFGWYKVSEFPRVAEQLLQILSHSRPASEIGESRARDRNYAVALGKREILKILDVILSSSMNLIIDNWLEARQSDEGLPDIANFIHLDFGLVSRKTGASKSKVDLLGKAKTLDKNRTEMMLTAEASVRHLLLELLLYDQVMLEQVASRLLMRLYNQHKIILHVLQHAVVLQGEQEHAVYFVLDRGLHTVRDVLYYDTWERNQVQVASALQEMCSLIIKDRRPVRSTQALLNKMGLVSTLLDFTNRAFKSAGPSPLIHEAYRLLYCFCFENHANQVVVRNSGVQVMVQHLLVSPFVIKCLYMAARTNRLVPEMFTSECLASIVHFYSKSKNPICLKLLAVLIQPTPLDKPLRVMQNQICALLLHPQYHLFGTERDLIAAELGRNPVPIRLPVNLDFEDPLDFTEDESPFFQLLSLLSACAEGAYRTAEQRCRDMVSADSILRHMTHPGLTFPVKGSLLSFLDEVYLDSPSASELFQPDLMPKVCALLESIREDVTKLLSGKLSEEMKQGVHSQMNLYVIDVAVRFLSTLGNVLVELAPLPAVNAELVKLHETFSVLLKDQGRMQTILSCPPEGWSEAWMASSGLGGVRAKKVLSAMEGMMTLCGLPNRSCIPALDPALTELNLHAKSLEQDKAHALPLTLITQLQQGQEQVFQTLTEMFSDSLSLVMQGADKRGFHGLKQLAPLLEMMGSTLFAHPVKAPAPNLRTGELILHIFSSTNQIDLLMSSQQLATLHGDIVEDDDSRYKNNVHLWDAVMRHLTREAGVVESGDDDRQLAHYHGYDALSDFLQVICSLLANTTGSTHHHIQRHLNSMNLMFVLMSIVCNCKREGSVLVKALQIGAQMLHGRGGHHHHQHIQQSFLDGLRTPTGKQFMSELKSRLRSFVHKIDQEARRSRHTPGEIAVIISIVEFVQLCFEGHHLELQAYLNVQGDVERPVSLLVETGAAFDSFSFELVRMIRHENKKWQRRSKAKLHVVRPKFLSEEDEVGFVTFLELGKAFLSTFTRACRAPYFLNRSVLSKSALKGAERILKVLHGHRGSGSADSLELAIYEFWLALLEVAHVDRADIVSAFVSILDVNLACAALEVHWQKSIVASSLPLKNHFQPSQECHALFSVLALISAEPGAKCEAVATRFTAWKHQKSHRKILRNSLVPVEILRNGLLNRVYFPVPDMFKKNHREIKDAKRAMLYEVNRSNTEEQLLDFLRLVEGLVTLGLHEQALRRLPGQWGLKLLRRQEWWRYTLLLCFVINVLLTTFANHTSEHLPHAPYLISNDGVNAVLIVLGVGLVLTLLLTVTRFSLGRGAQMFVTFRKQERAQRDRAARAKTGRVWLPLNVKAALLLVSSPLVVYSLLSVLFAFMGLFWSPFFFAFHLLDTVLHFRSLKHIQELITRRMALILATIANAGIIVYFFAVVAFVFHLPYEYEHGNHTLFHCDSMKDCVQAQFLNGFHKHSPVWEDPNHLGLLPALYDQLMYFLVFVMHTITIGAVIIDSFGEFRETRGEIEERIHHECFVCGIDRDTFNFKGSGFAVHIKHEHHMWNYVYLKQYLQEKRAAGRVLGGQEQFLLQKFEARAVDFFPTARALSLEPTAPPI